MLEVAKDTLTLLSLEQGDAPADPPDLLLNCSVVQKE